MSLDGGGRQTHQSRPAFDRPRRLADAPSPPRKSAAALQLARACSLRTSSASTAASCSTRRYAKGVLRKRTRFVRTTRARADNFLKTTTHPECAHRVTCRRQDLRMATRRRGRFGHVACGRAWTCLSARQAAGEWFRLVACRCARAPRTVRPAARFVAPAP
eukprot:1146461-Pleurochrysis_carterae.AAC.2